MFNSIRGLVSGKFDGDIYVFSGGIEWDLAVPAIDLARLPALGEECRVFTWLYHREDQMKLFGFESEGRRHTFLELLKVEGIGPKAALKIMGGIGQQELEQALENGDLSRLEAVPGLGKKTAQKMILALKGKLTTVKAVEETKYGELLDALQDMGYDKHDAFEALARADREIPAETGKEGSKVSVEREKLLFKQAIVYLSNSF